MTPGVIRCNETRKCDDFKLENISFREAWWQGFNGSLITEYIDGDIKNVNIPVKFG